ncbi:carbohydrate kinase [Prodigiosinella confusarubida]|uniref:Carbohydrate kinase n=1 Tax=Serratia sp. (strain ATCC 39006) TaxID=104623 RepID=A0A2I5T7V8_SERS3|nr:FGGY-family carbohydrate kinase [Serratia sp. ATCC 39006]AUH00663.1 carbohydrate kinase [Serratia sp. ATCC 39006]AUH04984.1 carbohydrate kinase [Serratia sp. ATCC 39006]
MSCLLGIDIGTTSTIGILIRLPDHVLGIVSRPVTLSSPKPGWTEESPDEWWKNLGEITRELLQKNDVVPADIAGIGVTGMLPAIVLLDDSGQLLRPSIQQSDGRCGEQVDQMRGEVDADAFIRQAGNGINQQLAGAKIRWLEQYEPDVFARIATVFGSYDFINWKLTGERCIEQNWALEAGLVNVVTDEIDDQLVSFAHLHRDAVPRLVKSDQIIGAVTEEAARCTGLMAGTPVVGGAADMIASALGAGVTHPGDILLKFGGSVDVLTASSTIRPDPRLYLDYHLIPGLYMPNGCMSTGGSALNWFADNFAGQHLATATAQGLSLHQYLDTLAAAQPAGSDGLLCLPYFLGEKTPLHDPLARGVFFGLTLSHNGGHFWRALLEAYAYAIYHHIETLRDIGYPVTRFIVSDGGSHSRLWMQIVADVLMVPLQRLSGHPGSCLGAAWTAAMGVGVSEDWNGASEFVHFSEVIMPNPDNEVCYREGYRLFRALYESCKPLTHRGFNEI